MLHLRPDLCYNPPSERVTKTKRSPVTLKAGDLGSLSADLIPLRKPDGSPCGIVVNRDSFRYLGFRETLQRRQALQGFPESSIRNRSRCRHSHQAASPSDALFPVRRREEGITTGVALHNLGEEAIAVMCRLMRGGVLLEEVAIPLAANGQTSWLIDAAFPAADTSDFAGAVRCDAPGRRRFSAVALEMDPGTRIFLTLPLFPVDRGGGGPEAALDFAHFANGDGTTSDLVFVNLSTERSRPAPTPFHTDILPIRPAIYFYDTEGALVSAESVVDVTGDLVIQEDGALTVLTEMEPLGVLTISTHGQGALVSGSVKVVADGPIGGMLRSNLPHIGEAVVGASPPLGDALFPVRRREEGITTGVALHNLESSPGLVHCDLMQEGVLRDAASFPLEANGQTSWLIDQEFRGTDTSEFVGSVRCDAVGEGRFSAVALEMDPVTRIFTTLPVFPVPEMPDRE